MPHLVGALPEGAGGVPWLRQRGRCRPPQRPHQQHRQHAAAAEQRHAEQHHQRQQPVAIVAAGGDLLALCRDPGGVLRIQHAQRLEIRVAGRQRHVAPAAAVRQPLQRGRVQPRLAIAAAGARVGATARGAQAEDRHPVARVRRLARGRVVGAVGAVGQHQDVAALEAGLPQQLLRPGDPAIHPGGVERGAVAGHEVGRQRVEEQGNVGRVLGQRRHGVGIVGEHHQRHLPALAFAQQGGELGARLRQPRWRQVARQHRVGQVQRDHQRRSRLPKRALLLAQARPGQRQHRERHPGQRQHAGPCAARRMPCVLQQVRQQVRIDRIAPGIAFARLPAPPPPEQRQQQQDRQPPGTQELEVGQGVHCDAPARRRTASAIRPSMSAAPSGSG